MIALGRSFGVLERAADNHPYKGALYDLRDINEYSRRENHAAAPGNPAEETSIVGAEGIPCST